MKFFKKNSKLLIIITGLEIILSLYFLIYLNYIDKLNYSSNSHNLTLLVQNMYTSTWWALIVCMIVLISILSLTSIIYKKNYLHFISILIWITLLILALDFSKDFKYNLSNLAIFIPIILINIKAYFNQKTYIEKKD